jgi:eukaryotic-like serine/threonine-protein kinase
MDKDIIKFIRQKDFELLRKIGNGALGETVLLKDEQLNVEFVCKKYKPISGISKEKYFRNFLDEIKILHLLYHKNIVRIFNYYLYPDYYTGYIVMEFIEGEEIDVYLQRYPENINNIFEQVIEGFVYLEENKILHRDIRPSNIMVDKNHNVKVIDFGFGKQIEFIEDNKKSISLNWWGGEIPQDFEDNIYDIQTEVFFIGKLFKKIIDSIDSSFKYYKILNKMTELNPLNRFLSFQEILREIKTEINLIDLFDHEEKQTYQEFANYFSRALSLREDNSKILMNCNVIIKDLELLHKRIMLEDYVNSINILRILISGSYKYKRNESFPLYVFESFVNLLKNCSSEKQNIILYNLETRFLNTQSFNEYDESEIPF